MIHNSILKEMPLCLPRENICYISFMQLKEKEVLAFQKKILDWYAKNQRHLPWRHPSLKLRNGKRDPYKILISEVMSQQTQIGRVIPKYEAWLKVFPTIQDLARASTRDVLLYWSGLGYNRRALYLQKCAKEVVEKYHGKIPEDEKILLTLPGIGEYTARAILCFGFNKQVAVVDTNVRKVILVHFKNVILRGTKDLDSSLSVQNEKNKIQEIADQLLPVGHAYEWNQALMDYAAAELKQQKIPIPKQSKFKDSDRYYRGQILKFLLTYKTGTKDTIYTQFASISTMTPERFDKIVQSLIKDKLVVCEEKTHILSLDL